MDYLSCLVYAFLTVLGFGLFLILFVSGFSLVGYLGSIHPGLEIGASVIVLTLAGGTLAWFMDQDW